MSDEMRLEQVSKRTYRLPPNHASGAHAELRLSSGRPATRFLSKGHRRTDAAPSGCFATGAARVE